LSVETTRTAAGRPRATTAAELSHVALQLFLDRGFDETTIDDVAAAAGVGRRTVFRYFSSKNDLPWGDFDRELTRMRRFLAATPADVPVFTAVRDAVIDFNAFPSAEVPFHRERMRLIMEVPALVAHSTLRYAAWRDVVARFVAVRTGQAPSDFEPQVYSWSVLAACLAAYEQWLACDDADLLVLLDQAMTLLAERVGP
jgi:mycofactocin system transcriptional regulator